MSRIDYAGGQARSVAQANDRVSRPKWGTRVVPMGMEVVYIPPEAAVKVSTGLSHQGLIEAQICNRNPVPWAGHASG